jgi:hypothetical protein
MTGSPLLSLSAIAGATASTILVWDQSDRYPSNSPFLTNSEPEIEQRIANLEMILSNQELNLEKNIKQLESKK